MRVIYTKLVDGLVLLLATKTAALQVLHPTPERPGAYEAATWYCLAALYAGCIWVCGAGRRFPAAVEVFARAILLFGALLSLCLAHQFSERTGMSPIHLFDWLALGACSGSSALLDRIPSDD